MAPVPRGVAQPTEDRFWLYVNPEPNTGCWLWGGHTAGSRGAYGTIWDNRTGRNIYAHRFAYEHLVGPVPHGLQLDHLCRVRFCVNPSHLEPVTIAENQLRGLNGPAFRRHCPAGHLLDETRAAVNNNGRVQRRCQTCHAEAQRRYRQRRTEP